MQKRSEKNKNNYWFMFFLLFVCTTKSQTRDDLELIARKENYNLKYETKREVSYVFKHRHPFIKYNPISLFFGGMLMMYQKYISVQVGANCPYEISCSNFSKECIKQYGIIYGIPLTADRLTRCTRLVSFDLIRGVDYNSKTNKIYDNPNEYKLKKK